MIVGAVCLFGMFCIFLYKFLTTPDFTITIQEVIALIILGIAPSIPFCPVFLSIILDKAKEMKEIKFTGKITDESKDNC